MRGEVGEKKLDRAILAERESKRIEFVEKFDANQAKDWCELVKEIVAMANSGGGIILIGVRNDGSSFGEDVSAILQVDPAHLTDKIAKYTGEQFDEFVVCEAYREGCKIAVLDVGCASIPMVFNREGAYAIEGGRQKTAFPKGSVYFRHGAKSEPGNTVDLRKSIERELTRVRKGWLRNIRKLIYAPSGEVVESELGGAHPIRVVDDPNAPAYRQVWDESAYQSPQEILVGVLKSWRRDKGSYASESDIWELYAYRDNLQLDEEKAECLLECAINRHAPFFFFAQLLTPQRLIDFVKRVAASGKYPAPNMAVRLAYAIGGKAGSELLDCVVKNCVYPSVKSRANKLKQTVSQGNRIKGLCGTYVRIGTQPINVGEAKASDLEALMAEAFKAKSKMAIKDLDAFLYAPNLEASSKV